MSKLAHTITGVIEGELKTHLPGFNGNYDTLCGLSLTAKTSEKNSVVNCTDCISIFEVAIAYKPVQFRKNCPLLNFNKVKETKSADCLKEPVLVYKGCKLVEVVT